MNQPQAMLAYNLLRDFTPEQRHRLIALYFEVWCSPWDRVADRLEAR